MILALIRYIPSAIIDLVADFLALVMAPVAACFVARIDGRDHIHPYWRWITTHDAPVDEWWHGGYGRAGWIKRRFNSADYRRSAVLRWACRVMWIWRNPAYQVAHWLGYDQTGVDTTRGLYKDPRWDSGKPNKAFWRVKNKKGQTGFLAQGQLYYYKNWCIEYQFGWKLYRRDPDKRCMLAFRISPFKRYP